MIVTCVFISVKAKYLEEFKSASRINHENSLLESGNLRFDILQHFDDECKFTFYEAYDDEKAIITHKNTQHYLTWKETVEPYMAEPRRSVKHIVIFPDDPAKW